MRKSIIIVALEWLTKENPYKESFSRREIYGSLVDATAGSTYYDPFITFSECCNRIERVMTGTKGNPIIKHETGRLTRYKKPDFNYSLNKPKIVIPEGYTPYISASSHGPYENTHLLNVDRPMCANLIRKTKVGVIGKGEICPACLDQVKREQTERKLELLRLSYDQLKAENNALQLKNNELESQLNRYKKSILA